MSLIVPEVAQILRCSARTIRDMARRGELRGSFIAGRWIFEDADVEAYKAEQANRDPHRKRRRRAA